MALISVLTTSAVTIERAHAQEAPPASTMDQAVPGTASSIDFQRPDGSTRNALISMTSNYDPAKPVPVVFAFGGAGDSPENFRNYSRLANTPAATEAVVVYPRGIDNVWEGAPYSKTARGEDVDFVRQILAELQGHFAIDTQRVYALGMSNGGGFALNLACQAPDMLAGVVGVSGAYYNPVNEGCAPGAVPTMMMHGNADTLTHYEGGLLHDAPYLPAPALHQSISQRNGCTGSPVINNYLNGVVEDAGAGCAKESVLWTVEGQNHDWWFAPDAANAAWSFLARQSQAVPEPAPVPAPVPMPEPAPVPAP